MADTAYSASRIPARRASRASAVGVVEGGTRVRPPARRARRSYTSTLLRGVRGPARHRGGGTAEGGAARRLTGPLGWVLLTSACAGDALSPPAPEPDVGVVPVVVHVVHHGEPIGVGHNLSTERIHAQIRILNEDFRRESGTPGFNDHPDGGDARLEFVLASVAPDGSPTDGIVRTDATEVANPTPPGSLFDYYAYYGYWDPEHYVNVWTMPLAESTVDVLLGLATGPETDLPGAERFEPGEPAQAEGILINSAHFGPSDLASAHNLGRTLTHEMGHYFGLLHLWGGGDCAENDHCVDTPAMTEALHGCPSPPPPGCDGTPVMVENYMNYTDDACMNTFTNDQIARIHYVLENSPRRRTLTSSPGLGPR